MRTGIRRVTVAELHADTEAIIAELPHTEGIEITASDGKIIATLAPARDLSPEEAAAVRRAIEEFERSDPATWIDHEDVMKMFDDLDDEETVAPA